MRNLLQVLITNLVMYFKKLISIKRLMTIMQAVQKLDKRFIRMKMNFLHKRCIRKECQHFYQKELELKLTKIREKKLSQLLKRLQTLDWHYLDVIINQYMKPLIYIIKLLNITKPISDIKKSARISIITFDNHYIYFEVYLKFYFLNL